MCQRVLLGCVVAASLILGIAVGARAMRPGDKKTEDDRDVVLELRFRMPASFDHPLRLPKQPITPRLFQQGALVKTGNPLDLAINGEGFLQVTLPDGDTAYTRGGALRLTPDNKLANADGYPLCSPVTIPFEAVSISITTDGNVLACKAGSPNFAMVGQLVITRFVNPPGLIVLDNGLFKESADSGAPMSTTPGLSGAGTLHSGFLEKQDEDLLRDLLNLVSQFPQRFPGDPRATIALRRTP